MERPFPERLRLSAIALTHGLTYALAVAAVATAGALVLGLISGGGLVHTKIFLFVSGWLLMGYAVVRLWPSDPSEVSKRSGSVDPTGETIGAVDSGTRFQQTVDRLPPVRWLPQPSPGLQLTDGAKLFLGSVMVLLTSFLMETVFGVV